MNSQNVLVSVPVYTKMLDLDNDKLKRIILLKGIEGENEDQQGFI